VPVDSRPAVAIVGAGFGGLAAAIELKRRGYDNFVIFERGGAVGGVWRENRYPGVACDVPSPIYSFSYSLKPDWSQLFGTGTEIQSYLEEVADQFGLREHLSLNSEVVATTFDEDRGTWSVELASGETREVDVLIMATGQLSRPKLPDLPGHGSFAGPSFHSAEWDHDVDLTGKAVVVVGSGASAIQVVPAIAGHVAELTVIQRSPNWVIRKSKRRHGALARALFTHVPLARRIHHNLLFVGYECRWPVVTRKARPIRVLSEWWYKRLIRKHLSEPEEARAATPDYAMMCNRLLLSNDWYPTLARDHVHLVGEAVTEVVAEGVVTDSGRLIEADVIVWCTGFRASEFLAPIRITGRGGADLHARWTHGAEAYLGLAVPEFPNMFMLFGPNTNSITNSIVFLLERQARYIRLTLDFLMAHGGGWVDLRRETNERFQRWLQGKLDRTVFTDTCPGWYTNAEGKVTAMWPLSHLSYAWHTRRFDVNAYEHHEPGGLPTSRPSQMPAVAVTGAAEGTLASAPPSSLSAQ
jgi:cation diffusion facilitator CzcD-associated flavoprotein CzcO